MIERCEQSGFAFEARHAIGVRGERRRQDLQRDVALQLGVARAIHLAHPAGPEGAEDLVDADAGARFNGHGGCVHYMVGTARPKSGRNPLD